VTSVTGAEPAARAWSEHLRHGGATTWSEWVRSGAVAELPPGWQVPGAAQLEVVRRLATTGWLRGAAFTRLADLVLSRSGPGRGLAQQPLALPGAVPPPYGAPPVDPAAVPAHELLRVAVGVLVELALATPGPRPGEPTGRRLARVLRLPSARGPQLHLTGAPVTASVVRAELQAAGHREHGASPTVVVLGLPFDRLLAEVWSARVQRGAAVRWPGFARRWSGRPQLPPSADLAALAEQWAGRVGADRVHVVVPGPGDRAGEVVARVLGLEPPDAGVRLAPAPRWAPLTPAAVDVVRRANAVLGVRVDPARHREVLQPLLRALGASAHSTGAVTVPGPFHDWARSRAEHLRQSLSDGGYRVHGDLRGLAPVLDGPTRPDVGEALQVALDACLRLAPTSEGEDRQ
jgi:hypothetical protein